MITDSMAVLESRRRVFDWLHKTKLEPLVGAPIPRREKEYSAESGYVYRYTYAGRRRVRRGGEQGTEYVFDVTTDGRAFTPVSVFVCGSAAEGWQQAHGRSLTSAECHAVAKIALFQAFDERQHPGQMKQEARVRAADLEAILEKLGIE